MCTQQAVVQTEVGGESMKSIKMKEADITLVTTEIVPTITKGRTPVLSSAVLKEHLRKYKG